MNDDKFWLLVARHFSGEGSAEDEAELKKILDNSPEDKARYEALVLYWGKSKQRGESELAAAYRKVQSRLEQPTNGSRDRRPLQRSRTMFRRGIRISIAACLLITAGFFTWRQLDEPASAWNTRTNSKGQRSTIVLADGSTVWLNAESKLRYPDKFSGGVRQVYLEGEAFFDVTKNPQVPFVIHLSDGIVRVVGTSFNIKAFKNENKVETSVVTGKVAFIAKGKNVSSKGDSVLITPNLKAVYFKESKELIQLSTDSNEDKAWIDGTLIFKSTSFNEITKVLERTFGKKIVFDNEGLKACKLTATFANTSLDEVLELLSKTKDYTYKEIDGEWHIDGTGCAIAP